MASQKKIRRKVRYDRLLVAGILLILCIVLISGCVKKLKSKQNAGDSENTIENITITNETANAENYPKISIETSKVHSGHLILVNQAFPCRIDEEAGHESAMVPPSKEPQKAKKLATPPQASRHFTKSHHLEYKTFILQL